MARAAEVARAVEMRAVVTAAAARMAAAGAVVAKAKASTTRHTADKAAAEAAASAATDERELAVAVTFEMEVAARASWEVVEGAAEAEVEAWVAVVVARTEAVGQASRTRRMVEVEAKERDRGMVMAAVVVAYDQTNPV